MSIRKSMISSLIAVLSASALAAPVYARPYLNGTYTGTVTQAIPHSYSGPISFHVHAHRLTKLHFDVTMVCSKALIAQVDAPLSKLKITLAHDGSFSYAGTVGGTRLKLHGVVRGHEATGKFFESFRTAPGHRCTMLTPAPFRTRV